MLDTKTSLYKSGVVACVMLAFMSANSIAQTSFTTAQGYFENAREQAAMGKEAAAKIQLKNALQIDSEHVPSLIFLGRLEQDSGAQASAALLFSDALLVGGDPELVTPMLARALSESGQYSDLLDDIPATTVRSPIHRAEIHALRARALISLGRLQEVSAEIDDARQSYSPHAETELVASILALRRGALTDALEFSRLAVTIDSASGAAHAALGDALQANGSIEAAIESYETALSLTPEHIDARIALLAIYFRQGNDSAAQPHIAYLSTEAKNEPRAVYFAGLAAARQGDTPVENQALTRSAALIDAIPSELLFGNPQLLMTGALSNFGLGNFTISASYLERYLGISSEDPGALRLYAANLLAMGKYAQAKQLLLKLNKSSPGDANVRSMLGTAYAATGNHVEAARLLSELDGVDTGQHANSAQYAIALINSGQSSSGLEVLRSVLEKQPALSSLRYSLAVGYLKNGRPDLAREQIDLLASESGEDRMLKNLTAVAEKRLGNPERAGQIWSSMLEDDSDDVIARVNLAQMARQRGDFESARALLYPMESAIVDSRGQLTLEKAKLAQAEGNLSQALKYSEQVSALVPASLDNVGLQAELLIALEKPSEAESLVARFAAGEDAALENGLLYSDTLVALGKPKQALLVLTQLSRRVDFDIAGLTQIAARQSRLGEPNAAINTLEQALKVDRGYLPARLAQLQNLLLTQRYEDAILAGNAFSTDFPGSVIGTLGIAEAELNLGNLNAAVRAYETAKKQGAVEEGALGIYRTLRKRGQLEASKQALREGLQQLPENLRLTAALSDVLINEQNWRDALPLLDTILEQRPDSVAHLNNRALARSELGEPGALEDAQKAQQLDPSNPQVNDTLGLILVKSGDAFGGLGFLREASVRSSKDPSIKLHLAMALSALGRDREALSELYQALETDQLFSERSLAEDLQKALQK